MSQSGSIVFYTEEQFEKPEDALFRIFSWLGATQLYLANRTISESQEWKLTLAAQEDDDVEPYDPDESVCNRSPVSALKGAYMPGRTLIVDLSTAPRTDLFCKTHAELDPKIRGDFNPGSPIIRLGHHDLFEEDGEGELHYVARAFCSIRIFGYGTPANDKVYRKMIWSQPFVQDFEMEVLKLLAPHPIKHAAIFSY